MTNRGNKRRLRDLQSLSQKGGGRRKKQWSPKGGRDSKGRRLLLVGVDDEVGG